MRLALERVRDPLADHPAALNAQHTKARTAVHLVCMPKAPRVLREVFEESDRPDAAPLLVSLDRPHGTVDHVAQGIVRQCPLPADSGGRSDAESRADVAEATREKVVPRHDLAGAETSDSQGGGHPGRGPEVDRVTGQIPENAVAAPQDLLDLLIG